MEYADKSGGMIDVGRFSPETRRAWKEYSDRCGFVEWMGDRRWIESHWFAWLIELLKAEADIPSLFPEGKWATIQRMQLFVENAAKNAVLFRESGEGER